ncbi:hypothetical protein VTL71DRAFT_12741 [Oculimacula yallundae]|uniref:Uncharacterized protein n=1 Tax=Oculimacula yallundae TaxID=86028 RepID=A0ABR4CQM6_9HELO
MLPVILLRPNDFRFHGPAGKERHVDTIVPTHAANFRNLARLNHKIQNAATMQVTTSHLYPIRPTKTAIDASTSSLFWTPASPTSLLEAIWLYAKSYISILAVICGLGNGFDQGPNRFTALLLQETNKGVDSLALTVQGECRRHNLDMLIIRVGYLPTEKSKFTSKVIEPTFSMKIQDMDTEVMVFLAQRHVYSTAKKSEQARQRGDKRFVPQCRNLTLHEAMWERANRLKSTHGIYLTPLTNLDTSNRNPEDDAVTVKSLNPLIEVLLIETLQSADVIVTTLGQALRSTVHEAVPAVSMILLDEGCKRSLETTLAVIGAYEFQVLADNGDNNQIGVFSQTQGEDTWNPMKKVVITTLLGRTIKDEVRNMVLYEQHRMWTHDFTAFLSDEYYNGQMVDGTLARLAASGPPPEVTFCENVIENMFGLRTNILVVLLKGSRSEQADHSVFNRATQLCVLNTVKAFNEALESNEAAKSKPTAETPSLNINEPFTITCLSPYNAEASMIDLSLDKLDNKNFSSMLYDIEHANLPLASRTHLAASYRVDNMSSLENLLVLHLSTAWRRHSANKSYLLDGVLHFPFSIFITITSRQGNNQITADGRSYRKSVAT